MITLRPLGGLCNRLRALSSGIALRDGRGEAELLVCWERNPGLNASFRELFEPIAGVNFRELQFAPNWSPVGLWRTTKERFGWYGHLPWESYDMVMGNAEVEAAKKEPGGVAERISSSRSPYLSTWLRFEGPPQCICVFRPIPRLMQRVEGLTSLWGGKPTTGVHIRRTDNSASTRSSPLEAFFEAMETEVKREPNAAFFVATDDAPTERLVRNRFPGRIWTAEKVLDRGSPEGIEDAVVDLWTLSRTSKILGSYFSSFSHTAAELSGIPEVTVRAQSD